jgi:hypothetical protein
LATVQWATMTMSYNGQLEVQWAQISCNRMSYKSLRMSYNSLIMSYNALSYIKHVQWSWMNRYNDLQWATIEWATIEWATI